jgi:hypothetical protein
VGANQRVHSIAPFAALPLQAPADGDEEGERGDLEASHRPWSGGRAGGLEAVPEEEVAAWRERWFGGPVSRALYTIYEEEQETETPFYTPPRAGDGGNNGATAYAVPIQLTH